MRLTIPDSVSQTDPEGVRVLKRIERDVSEEIAGCLALLTVDASRPVDKSVRDGVKLAGLLGTPEREVTRDEAKDVLTGVIERDLAYRARRPGRMDPASNAAAFLGLFVGEGARFFTNGEIGLSHRLDRTGAWAPLTRATFDTGIVAVAGTRVGVFWVEDED